MTERIESLPSLVDRQYIGSCGANSEDRLGVIDEHVIDSRNLRLELVKRLDAGPQDVVIDEGSSNGTISRLVRKHRKFYGTLIGLEIALDAISSAANIQVKEELLPARFVNADMTELPFADESAHALINSLTWHHAKSDEKLNQAIDEAHRVLVPGGQLLVLVNSESQKQLHTEYLKEGGEACGLETQERFAMRFSKESAPDILRDHSFVFNDDDIITQSTEMHFIGEDGLFDWRVSLNTYFSEFIPPVTEEDDDKVNDLTAFWRQKYLGQIAKTGYVSDNIDRIIINARKPN
ncbi:MAG TPA: methyltransferase domain-containing protein [Candidatus Saccharimonadales bacterium]|nr:methyltransferase domain-containing protein [Candidatus Saccharimonadales bacterium]